MQKVLLHEFKSIISIPYFPNFLSLFLTHTLSLSLSYHAYLYHTWKKVGILATCCRR